MVELKDITKENYEEIFKLKVAEKQSNFVSSNVYSLAQAWVYKNTTFPFAIYADGILVGFIMLGYYEEKDQYTLWKFMIDEGYQHQGYGKKALKLAIDWLVDTFHVKKIYTGAAFQHTVAEKLYRSFGFRRTGVSDEFQFEMELIIDSSAVF